MNNNQFLMLAKTLNMLAYQFQRRPDVPFKFLYGLKKNIALVNPPAQILDNQLREKPTKFPERLEECEKARLNLCIEYAGKDDNGNPKRKLSQAGQDVYDIPDDKTDDFKAAVKSMMDGYPEILAEREEHEKAANELLSEGAPDIEFYRINIAHFPESGITAEQIDILAPIIDESEESKLIKLVH